VVVADMVVADMVCGRYGTDPYKDFNISDQWCCQFEVQIDGVEQAASAITANRRDVFNAWIWIGNRQPPKLGYSACSEYLHSTWLPRKTILQAKCNISLTVTCILNDSV